MSLWSGEMGFGEDVGCDEVVGTARTRVRTSGRAVCTTPGRSFATADSTISCRSNGPTDGEERGTRGLGDAVVVVALSVGDKGISSMMDLSSGRFAGGVCGGLFELVRATGCQHIGKRKMKCGSLTLEGPF